MPRFRLLPRIYRSPEIVAFYSVYGHPDTFEQSVNSIVDYVDGFIVVFGRYKGFPELAEDGRKTYEKVTEKYDGVFLDVGVMPQTEKRSLCFRLVPTGQWIFVIDDDEVVEGDKAAGFARIRAYSGDFALVHVVDESLSAPRVRFMRSRPNLRYGPTHWQISDDTGRVLSDYTSAQNSIFIPDITVKNACDSEKPRHYNEAMSEYLKFIWQKKYVE